jgi:hypothetical protein
MHDVAIHAAGLAGALAVWACPAAWLWLGVIGPTMALACLAIGAVVMGIAALILARTDAPPLPYAFAAGKPRRLR